MKHLSAQLGLAALAIGGALAVATTAADAQGIGEDSLERMLVPTERKIQRGERIFENQCAGCHGDTGKGDVEYPNADKYNNPAPNFQQGQFRYGGGPIQIYNAITYGLPGQDAYHPVFPPRQLRYQERFAVAHYVRSLVPAKKRQNLTDPPAVVQEARKRARQGVCKQPVRNELDKTIGKFLEPKGESQMETAKTLYESNCQSCHGETGKGDGPAGGALNPPPRNFHAKDNKWTNGTSPLAIYNTLLNGISGTSMAAYPNMSAEERWALTHYVRKWIPESKRQQTTEEDILKLCRSRSAPPAPDPISISKAQRAVLQDTADQRAVQLQLYGEPEISAGADPERGRQVYNQNCAECHGSGLQGKNRGPYGLQPPFFQIRIRPLTWRHAGGDYMEFARRTLGGVHASLVDAPRSAMLTKQQWRDLHAFVGTHDAPDRVTIPTKDNASESTDASGDKTTNQESNQTNQTQSP